MGLSCGCGLASAFVRRLACLPHVCVDESATVAHRRLGACSPRFSLEVEVARRGPLFVVCGVEEVEVARRGPPLLRLPGEAPLLDVCGVEDIMTTLITCGPFLDGKVLMVLM